MLFSELIRKYEEDLGFEENFKAMEYINKKYGNAFEKAFQRLENKWNLAIKQDDLRSCKEAFEEYVRDAKDYFARYISENRESVADSFLSQFGLAEPKLSVETIKVEKNQLNLF